jgi:KipI family sensor histidine kinase inhibitor
MRADRTGPARPDAAPSGPLYGIQVQCCGDGWVMVDWGAHADANVAARALAARLRAKPPAFCAEAVAGVRTLAVRLPDEEGGRTRASHREAALEWLRGTAADALHWEAPPGRRVVLPACYDASLAPDLDEVAHAVGLSPEEVAERHAASTFTAIVVGFMPGFAYLAGLDPALKVDRRASPRPVVPEGAIAIAGLQTAVYPTATPGGWNLIGRCPARLFDAGRARPALMGEGDTVRFEPVDLATFERMWGRR